MLKVAQVIVVKISIFLIFMLKTGINFTNLGQLNFLKASNDTSVDLVCCVISSDSSMHDS